MMKLILKDTVKGLGKIGEIVDVRDGYARNYLLPKGFGLLTTPRNIKAFEHAKRVVADKIKKEKLQMGEVAQRIAALTLSIPVEANEEGHLFGSVTARDISDALMVQGIEMDRNNIVLEKPIKELGSFFISVVLPHETTAQIKVEVTRTEKRSEDKAEVKEAAQEPTAAE